jgi:hypothetical protein
MHIHGNQANLNGMNPYAAAAEKATAAQRTATTRKRLLKAATDTERLASPEEASLLAKWMDGQQTSRQGDVEYHTAASGKDSDFG